MKLYKHWVKGDIKLFTKRLRKSMLFSTITNSKKDDFILCKFANLCEKEERQETLGFLKGWNAAH